MSLVLDGTNGVTYPSWTTATRPSSPSTGDTGYNTTYGGLEIYNGSAWDTITGGPAFSAYQSSAQSISSATFTKVQFQTKEFDTNNNFDATTNYRFTPTVAGYYQINVSVELATTGSTLGVGALRVYKNGSAYKNGNQFQLTATNNVIYLANLLIYCNGTSDYLEVYMYQGSAGSLNTAPSDAGNGTVFQAFLARSA